MIRSIVFVLLVISPTVLFAQESASRASKKSTKSVAVLLFDGVELLDFAGPAEVFIVASQRSPFRVFTVAPNLKAIKTMGGITVKPDHSFEDSPPADILVVPGGNTRAVGTAGIQWIRKSAKEAEVVMSVCFGAFLLAEADLLDGVTATTHQWGIEGLKAAAPKCKVVSSQRFVDSGKVVTTGGVTAGIDGALHVVERISGKDVAVWTAEQWMEYRRVEHTTPSVNTKKP